MEEFEKNEELKFVEESEEEKVEEVIPSMDDFKDEIEKSFHRLREGDLVKGPVIGVGETEVTVDLGSYAEGIVPIDELSNDPKFSIKADIAVGDTVNAMVISADNGYGQVLLSMKKADDILAWDFLKDAKESEQIFRVKITEAVKAGVVTYLKGIRAFIPASGIDVSYVEDTEAYVGKTISVRILEVNEEERRLILSAKSVLREQEAERMSEKVSKLTVGSVYSGKIERIESYGAFVTLPDGLSGLVHISQMSDKRLKSPREMVTEGDQVKVMITGIKEGKISLSMKAVEEEETSSDEENLPLTFGEASAPTTSLGDLLKNLKL